MVQYLTRASRPGKGWGGPIWLAARAARRGDLVRVARLLHEVRRPHLLAPQQRAYFHYYAGLVHADRGELSAARENLQIAAAWPPGWRIYVISRTRRAAHSPAVTVVGTGVEATVAALRAESGLDIWLFGGGQLFASLLAAGLVDRVEVAVMPVILGAGVPLAGFDAPRSRLLLTHSHVHPSGIVSLDYDVQPAAG